MISTITIDDKIKIKKIEDLIDLPQTITVNNFTEYSAKTFQADFKKAEVTGQKIIPIIIDSYGGEIYALLSIIDVIKASKLPVATIVTGKAMSCGSILFSCGAEDYRFIGANATVMIHEVSNCTYGKLKDLQVDVKESERLNTLIFKILANNIGKEDDFISKIIHDKNHADWYLDAKECQALNLANHIRLPSFKVEISSEIIFSS